MDAFWEDPDQLRWKMGPTRSNLFVGFWLAVFATFLAVVAYWG